MSGLLEGFRAAAASLAIMGDIRPLLAEIFSMMEEVAKEVGVDAMAPSAPAVEQPWVRESVGMEWAPEDTADIRLAAGGGGWRGSLGMRGKNGLEAARALLERARATGMLLGRAWDNRLDMRWPAMDSVGAGLRVWPDVEEEETAVVGVANRCGTVVDCWVVGEALRLEFLLLMVEKSIRSSLLDSSGSSFGTRKVEERPITPEERMCRRSCLRLWEVIWLVEVKVKPQPERMQWKWLVALLYTQPSYLHSSYL